MLTIVKDNGGLNKLQHGFMPGRSSITNLLTTEHHIGLVNAINTHRPVDFIAFDFSRAFNKVPHELLLEEFLSTV